MAEKVWNASELEAMSPAEQDELFNARIVTDLDEVPAEFVARVRSRLADRTSGIDAPNPR